MTMTRRDFTKLSTLGLLGGALAGGSLATPSKAFARARRAEFTTLRRNVGIFTERGGTVGWLMNNEGVVIVDSQFADTAPLLLDGIRQRTQIPIDMLINSHHHGDHTGGNAVLRPAVGQIVAHARAAENQSNGIRNRQETDFSMVADVTYTDEWSTEVGDEQIHLRWFGGAHTGGDTVVHFINANVVHLGDLLNNHGFANIDAPAGGSVHGWIEVIDTLKQTYPTDAIYVFGHNEAGAPNNGSGHQALDDQRAYLSALIDVAQAALAAGQTREQAIALEVLPGFESYAGTATRIGLGVGIAYDELLAMR
jgi:cyclase